MWIEFNNNPVGRAVEDCTVRALSVALNISWDDAHMELSEASRQMGDMMHSTSVLSALLRKNGFTRHAISNVCPDCYTIEDFAYDHPKGTFVVGTGSHVVTIKDGNIWDSWNSSLEVPQFYWKR